MKTAYIQATAGISGDMLLGCLLNVGLPIETLGKSLEKLHISGYRIEHIESSRGMIRGTQVIVHQEENTTHGYSIHDFTNLVQNSDLSEETKSKSISVLQKLEAAEILVHGEGHELHELGDLDTIIDIVGVIAGFESLNIDKIYCSPLPLGWGIINTRKGPLPIPAPATSHLINMSNARVVPPTKEYMEAGELVTPTGAAIITTLASFDPPSFSVNRIGYGVGSRDIPTLPNVISIWLGETEQSLEQNVVSTLETNIDDSTPELIGYVTEKMLASGALDVWITPIYMKKNRPGVTLSVLSTLEYQDKLLSLMLQETSTLGVRIINSNRYAADREIMTLNTSLGNVNIKVKKINDSITSISPEYEDCKNIALSQEVPLYEVFRIVELEARNILGII